MQEWAREQQRDKLRELQIQDLQRKRWRQEEKQSEKDAAALGVLIAGGALLALAIACFPLFLIFVGVKWLIKGGLVKRIFSVFFIPIGAFGMLYLYWFVFLVIHLPGDTNLGDIAVTAFRGAAYGSNQEASANVSSQGIRSLQAGQRVSAAGRADSKTNGSMGAPITSAANDSDSTKQQTIEVPLASAAPAKMNAADPTEGTSAQETAQVTLQPQVQPKPASPDVQSAEAGKPEVAQAATIVASFDCTKASSPIEHLICSTPETANADLRLASVYSAARAKSNDPNALKADERNWLLNERNACSDATCLLNATEARIQKLSSM